jgi:hypothetical protein
MRGTDRVATFAYVNPAIATLLGWLVLGETLTPLQIVGTLVVLTSVAFDDAPDALALRFLVHGAEPSSTTGGARAFPCLPQDRHEGMDAECEPHMDVLAGVSCGRHGKAGAPGNLVSLNARET